MTQLLRLPLISDALDVSGNGHNATLYGSPSFVSDAKFGTALELNGSTQYGVVADHADLNSALISVGGWVYFGAAGGYTGWSTIVEKGAAAGWQYGLLVYDPDSSHRSFDWIFNTASGLQETQPVVDVFTGWHYVMATYDGSYGRVYLDAVEIGTATAGTGSLVAKTEDLYFGRIPSGSFPFAGRYHDLRQYNAALSQPEIAALMVLTTPRGPLQPLLQPLLQTLAG